MYFVYVFDLFDSHFTGIIMKRSPCKLHSCGTCNADMSGENLEGICLRDGWGILNRIKSAFDITKPIQHLVKPVQQWSCQGHHKLQSVESRHAHVYKTHMTPYETKLTKSTNGAGSFLFSKQLMYDYPSLCCSAPNGIS